jgi:hypothetical protein
MIKSVALATVFVPVLLVAISLVGLLFGAVGIVIFSVLRDRTDIMATGFRLVVVPSIVVVTCVGMAAILSSILRLAHRVGQRAPQLRRLASDSMLCLVAFGGLVGLGLLSFALLDSSPDPRLALAIWGGVLTTASGSILVPRVRQARRSATPPLSGDRPFGGR